MPYIAPLQDILFVMHELANLSAINQLPGYEEATPDTVESVLQEHARFCSEVIAPLNASGDKEGCTWHDGKVLTASGFKKAFKAFGASGWQGLQHPADAGGQGLPKLVAASCIEMLNAANLSFALCPLLTDSAIEALLTAGSDSQKKSYLANLMSGKWAGTMNLTEPQAGSDLAMVRSRAIAQVDGTYKVIGTKIFITYGEHDMAENIIHMVLARIPDAPSGVKGLSLFIVPKFLVNSDGSLGSRNDVQCISIEHKLGIRASPTAILEFGERGGAVGYLIGAENRGLEYMFIMMNAARFAVGMQGIGVAERAYQKAVIYARQRIQSRDLAGSAEAVAIIHQPDVRRMLMSMRAQTEAARALAYVTAAALDVAHHHPDLTTRKENQAFYEYLVPIVKGWSTEMAIDVASIGLQIHGGTGFIEETGAAQYYRDVRILSIYEGTTAIQANDLISRKTIRDKGAAARQILVKIRQTEAALMLVAENDLIMIRHRLAAASQALERVVNYVIDNMQTDVKGVFAGSVPYLKLAGIVLAGWQMARAALIAWQKSKEGKEDIAFYKAKIMTARFFADHVLSQAEGYRTAILEGSSTILALPEEQF